MNRILFLVVASFVSFFTISCEDSNNQPIGVQPVSNITYVQEPGGILFKWDNPATEISYVEITFKNNATQEKLQRVIVQAPQTEQLITGLPDANEREFTFKAYHGGVASSAVSIRAKGNETAFNRLASTLSVATKLNGISVSWNNQMSDEFFLYINIDSVKTIPDYEIVIKETGPGKRFVPINGVKSANLFLTVSDVNWNISAPYTFAYTGLEAGWLDRSIWKVIDFSSQEETKEQDVGGHLNSRAVCVLDGYTNTFWHTRWSSNVPGRYPHYITFDLGRKVILKKAQIYRRINNTNLNTFEIQGGPEKDGPWETIVEYVIKANNSAQTILFPKPVEYQFIRLFCTKGGGGNVHASLAEFSLFGQDIEEN